MSGKGHNKNKMLPGATLSGTAATTAHRTVFGSKVKQNEPWDIESNAS